MVRWLTALAATLAALAGVGCSTGPTSRTEVCASFDELGEQVLQGNGVFGNPLFHKARALADTARRYQGDQNLAADADALARIADSDSTSTAELMDATAAIANLCGHPLGLNALVPNGNGRSAAEPANPRAPVAPGPAGTRAATASAPPPAPSDQYRTVSGPGGLTVSIPEGWTVGDSPSAANLQATDPADPRSFVRFGASTPPKVPLLAEIESGERTNPNVRNGYRRVLLEPVVFQGREAVDWEFTFVKDGLTRHARGRYWRLGTYEYVIYVSGPDQRWESLRPVFDRMAETVIIH